VSIPFFLLVPILARRAPLAARLALPIVGALDTLFETKLFGEASGTLLFMAPCVMLAALSFHAVEKWWQRGLAAGLYVVFALAYGRLGQALNMWSPDELQTLFGINAFAVASLMAFTAIRYAGIERSR
jgi:hypothetical protein